MVKESYMGVVIRGLVYQEHRFLDLPRARLSTNTRTKTEETSGKRQSEHLLLPTNLFYVYLSNFLIGLRSGEQYIPPYSIPSSLLVPGPFFHIIRTILEEKQP